MKKALPAEPLIQPEEPLAFLPGDTGCRRDVRELTRQAGSLVLPSTVPRGQESARVGPSALFSPVNLTRGR